MERQKCPLTLKEFSGGPSGGREEVASIKHGGRTQARVGDEKQGGLRELYPAEVRAFMRPCLCWAGGGVQARFAWFAQSNTISVWAAETPGGPKEESRLGVITESFSEQLTFLHEFDQWSLEKGILDGRDRMCKGPEAGGRGRSRTEYGRQIDLECQGRGLGCVPADLGRGSGCL